MNNRRVLLKSYVWGYIVSNRLASLLNSIKGRFKNLTLIGNSVQGENPSPDNPQEIKSAGRKSKNLFNIADLRVGQVQKDGTINEKQIYYRTIILDVPEDGKYRITFNSNDDYTMLYFTEMYTNGVYSQPYLRVHAGSPNYYITLAKGKNILSFSTHTASRNIAFTTDHNIMIAAESASLVYEPYSDKYLLDVKVTGKNLLNLQKQPDVKETYLGWKVSNGEKIALSVKDKGNNADITGCYLGLSKTGGSSDGVAWVVNNGANAIKEIVSTNQYVSVYPPNETAVQKLLNRFDIQVEYGGDATAYEPYTEQSVQIAINEPLRSIGEYKDVLTKDGVVRKIKQITVNEKSNLIFYMESKNTFGYLVEVPDATQTNYTYSVISDRFVKTQYIDSNDTNGVVTLFGKQIIFRVSKEIANNIDTLKEWLVDNNITFNYVLESPITEPLPESVQQQLQTLHSENGTTHVFVDSGEVEAGISVTYKQKK